MELRWWSPDFSWWSLALLLLMGSGGVWLSYRRLRFLVHAVNRIDERYYGRRRGGGGDDEDE